MTPRGKHIQDHYIGRYLEKDTTRRRIGDCYKRKPQDKDIYKIVIEKILRGKYI